MTVPLIQRDLFDTPGDILERPHANCYWLVPGRVLAGEHPAAASVADVATRVDALLAAGIRRFVDLTEEGELASYVAALDERAAAKGVGVLHRRFAIRDLGVPSAALMRAILDAIYEAIEKREPVYVHCWAGAGRTGTVVGCLLREQGFAADEALAAIARKWHAMEKCQRHPKSPERPQQFAFIERWPDDGYGGQPAIATRRVPRQT